MEERQHRRDPKQVADLSERRTKVQESVSTSRAPINEASGFKSISDAHKKEFRNSLQSASATAPRPVEQRQRPISNTNRPLTSHDADPILQIRAALDSRPKTSAAACIDYDGPSSGTSSSTSRTNTTYDCVKSSTAFTSMAQTPAKRKSTNSNTRVSEQVLRDGHAASLVDATAKQWMAHELARRRGESFSNSLGRAPSHSSIRQPDSQRPPSRAGSITEQIKEYIRPRQSIDSLRSKRSEDPSRPPSRGSTGKASWWRGGGLRRKDSWSSFRSGNRQEEDDQLSRGLNLNRSLPPLPSLDQYREQKAAQIHISQLMRAQTQHTHAGPAATYTKAHRRSQSGSDALLHHPDLRSAVEEKMLNGAISPPISPLIKPTSRAMESTGVSVISHSPSRPQTSAKPSGVVTIIEARQEGKKEGFGRKFSRFFGRKKINTGNTGITV